MPGEEVSEDASSGSKLGNSYCPNPATIDYSKGTVTAPSETSEEFLAEMLVDTSTAARQRALVKAIVKEDRKTLLKLLEEPFDNFNFSASGTPITT